MHLMPRLLVGRDTKFQIDPGLAVVASRGISTGNPVRNLSYLQKKSFLVLGSQQDTPPWLPMPTGLSLNLCGSLAAQDRRISNT